MRARRAASSGATPWLHKVGRILLDVEPQFLGHAIFEIFGRNTERDELFHTSHLLWGCIQGRGDGRREAIPAGRFVAQPPPSRSR